MNNMEFIRILIKVVGITIAIFIVVRLATIIYVNHLLSKSQLIDVDYSRKLGVKILSFYSNLYKRYLYDQYINVQDKENTSFSILGTINISKLDTFNKDQFFKFIDVYKFPFLLHRDINHNVIILVIFDPEKDKPIKVEDIVKYVEDKNFIFQYIYNLNDKDNLTIGKYFTGYKTKRQIVKDIEELVDLLDSTKNYIIYDDILYYDPEEDNEKENT